jgi:PAS domain S-box-containing protein
MRAEVRFFVLSAALHVFWIVGYLLEIISLTLEQKIAWDILQWIPFSVLGVVLLEFTVRYTQQQYLIPLRARQIIALPAFIFIAFLFIPSVQDAVYADATLVQTEYFVLLSYSLTPLTAFIMLYAVGCVLLSLLLLFHRMRTSSRTGRVQIAYIFAVILIPMLLIVIPASLGWTFLGLRDLTPFGFGLGNLIIAVGIFRDRLFHIIPVARDLIIESLSEVVLVVDDQGRIMDHNRSFARFTTADVLIGEPAARVAPFWEALMARKGDGDLRAFYFHEDVRFTIEGREYIFNLFANPIHQPSGAVIGTIIIARDVTTKRTAAAARAEREQLSRDLETERALNETRAHFMRRIAHEFRTPLTVLRLNHDLMRHYSDRLTAAQREERLDLITRQIDLMSAMIQQLQNALASREAITVHPQTVQLSVVLDEVLTGLRTSVGAERTIEVTIAPEAHTVRLDPDLLRLWLNNLIGNACKYSPSGSVVEIHACAERGTLVLEVRDYGIGIPPEALPRLFEPFYRAPNATAQPGIGLGLSLVRDTVRAHGGEIAIGGIDGEPGTRATITLPGAVD